MSQSVPGRMVFIPEDVEKKQKEKEDKKKKTTARKDRIVKFILGVIFFLFLAWLSSQK